MAGSATHIRSDAGSALGEALTLLDGETDAEGLELGLALMDGEALEDGLTEAEADALADALGLELVIPSTGAVIGW